MSETDPTTGGVSGAGHVVALHLAPERGDALLEVVRRAAPCRRMDEALGTGAMKALHGRGGAVLRVVTAGTIRRGDTVRQVERDQPSVS